VLKRADDPMYCRKTTGGASDNERHSRATPSDFTYCRPRPKDRSTIGRRRALPCARIQRATLWGASRGKCSSPAFLVRLIYRHTAARKHPTHFPGCVPVCGEYTACPWGIARSDAWRTTPANCTAMCAGAIEDTHSSRTWTDLWSDRGHLWKDK